MLVIPIQPVPSQQVLCVLAEQNCQIAIYIRGLIGAQKVYIDLNSDGKNKCTASLAHNLVPLDACNSYDGFQGNLLFVDTQGLDDPQYTGFNTRWFLVYLTPAELLLLKVTPELVLSTVPILTLSEELDVTAPNAGNFSIAHGLEVVPALIEIIPTSAGAIWGQVAFADLTNVNLVASDIGMTAKVLIYTTAAAGLAVQTPALTLLVDSPAPGDFDVPHGLGEVPAFIEMLPTSDGAIWGRSPLFDGTNIHLSASEAGQTATIKVYAPVTGPINIEGPSTTLGASPGAPGAFSVPHGLSGTPSRIEILMISDGVIRADTPAFDDTNVFLVASDAGRMAKILVYA